MEQNCYNFKELISKFIDGELDYKQREFCESHMEQCQECRHLYENIEVTKQQMSDLPAPEVTPEFMEGLKEKILEAKEEYKEGPEENGFFQNIPTLSYVFGACIILLIAGFSFYQFNQETPTKKSGAPDFVEEKINKTTPPKNSQTPKNQQNFVSDPSSDQNSRTSTDSNTTSDTNSKSTTQNRNLDKMKDKIIPVQD